MYREKIPSDSPPSYRGQLIKYSYKITIGAQRVNSPVKLLRIPIRVLPLCETVLSEAGALCNETTEELTPANPFLEIQQKETPLDIALQSLQVKAAHFFINLLKICFLEHNCTSKSKLLHDFQHVGARGAVLPLQTRLQARRRHYRNVRFHCGDRKLHASVRLAAV